MKCSNNHDHKPIFIVNEVDQLHEKWRILKNDIVSEFPRVKALYEKLEPLILCLELAMLSPNAKITGEVFWISKNFKSYDYLNQEFIKFFDTHVIQLIHSAKL